MSIEDLRPDQATVDAATVAAESIDRVWGTIPDRLALMFRWMAGQPTAASTEPGGGNTPMWCDRHQRDAFLCWKDDQFCGGKPYRPGLDPTGEAAIQTDKAAADHRRVLKLLALRTRTDRELVQVLLLYPPHAIRAERAKAAGGEWCQSCYRDGQYHEPVSFRSARSGGEAYYSGRCRWCGAFRSEHRIDPPVRLLRLRHEGRRITVADVTDAIADERRLAAEEKTKAKSKGSKKRKAAA